jgi:hypothetical protein
MRLLTLILIKTAHLVDVIQDVLWYNMHGIDNFQICILYRQTIGWSVNTELQEMWEETVVLLLMIMPRFGRGGPEESISKIFGQDRRSADRSLKPGALLFETGPTGTMFNFVFSNHKLWDLRLSWQQRWRLLHSGMWVFWNPHGVTFRSTVVLKHCGRILCDFEQFDVKTINKISLHGRNFK